MPNRITQLQAEIASLYPGSTIKNRVENGIVLLRPDGKEEHRYSTGPLHWREKAADPWLEIDTDLEDSGDATWKHHIKSAKFDTLATDDGRRRFYPRRWITTEYVEFGILQYRRGNWRTIPTGVMNRIGNRIIGEDFTTHKYEIGFSGKGSRTHLVLKGSTFVADIRWQATLVGLDWDNGALVSQSDGERVGFIRPPTWTDSSEDSIPREIPWNYSGGYFTLTPDFTGAVYPITIDPDYSIAAGADDGYSKPATSYFSSAAGWLYVGNLSGNPYHAWFRFTNIVAAQGASCTNAYITVVASVSRSDDLLSDIYGVDEDNHVAPTTYAEWNTDHGIHTTATVAFDFTTNRTQGEAFATPDLSAIFDEIFARGGWASGNAVGIHWDDGGSGYGLEQVPASYENTIYAEPILSLTIAAARRIFITHT